MQVRHWPTVGQGSCGDRDFRRVPRGHFMRVQRPAHFPLTYTAKHLAPVVVTTHDWNQELGPPGLHVKVVF